MSYSSDILYYANQFSSQQREIDIEFQKRADAAYDLYWKAQNFPRKTKKRIRKQCVTDYSLYKGMINWSKEMEF